MTSLPTPNQTQAMMMSMPRRSSADRVNEADKAEVVSTQHRCRQPLVLTPDAAATPRLFWVHRWDIRMATIIKPIFRCSTFNKVQVTSAPAGSPASKLTKIRSGLSAHHARRPQKRRCAGALRQLRAKQPSVSSSVSNRTASNGTAAK